MRRRSALLLFALAAALLAPRTAVARSAAFGEYVKAARMLSEWRYDDARKQIDHLAGKWPKAVETRYLKAELAFVDGNYAGAADQLDGVGDDELGGQVGKLRSLVASTMDATKGFTSRKSAGGHFVIYYAPGVDEVIVDLAGEVLEKAYAAFGKDFGFTPPDKVRVELLGAPADLAKVSTLTEKEIETTGTIALCKYGKLMVVSPRATMFGYPWMDTMVHEYVHYVVSRLGRDTVPVWLQEGLARFQQSRWRAQPGVTLSAIDQHLLSVALKKHKLITFDAMYPSMAKLPSAEAASLAFAEVYTMVGWIQEKVGYDGIRQIIAKQRDGKSAQRAVAEVMDMHWSDVQRAWKKHLRGMQLSASRAFAGRAAGPRIRFDKGKGSEDNVGVDEVLSTTARKFARLGGLLRARGMSQAAAVEYEKALTAAPDDPFIAGKLSRTYLELSRYDKAIELAKPLAQADPDDPVAPTTLGVAHQALGDNVAAANAFELALRVSPFDPTVRCGLADAYQSTGDARRAQRERAACDILRNK